MAYQRAVPHIEGLVVDQEADDLAVGDVDHGLARLGIAVGRLRIRQRTDLIKAVQERAGRKGWFTLFEVAAQPDMPVGEGEDRFRLPEQVKMQLALRNAPRVDREDVRADHRHSRPWPLPHSPGGTGPAVPASGGPGREAPDR